MKFPHENEADKVLLKSEKFRSLLCSIITWKIKTYNSRHIILEKVKLEPDELRWEAPLEPSWGSRAKLYDA